MLRCVVKFGNGLLFWTIQPVPVGFRRCRRVSWTTGVMFSFRFDLGELNVNLKVWVLIMIDG